MQWYIIKSKFKNEDPSDEILGGSEHAMGEYFRMIQLPNVEYVEVRTVRDPERAELEGDTELVAFFKFPS